MFLPFLFRHEARRRPCPGAHPGASELAKATSLSTPTLSEPEFLKLVKQA